jgi:hypothetical protein
VSVSVLVFSFFFFSLSYDLYIINALPIPHTHTHTNPKTANVGTAFMPNSWDVRSSKKKRKNWIRALPIRGEIRIDDGAVHAIRRKQSLFAAGVKQVLTDSFLRNEVVRICDLKGETIALGLANYDREQFVRMKGKRTKEIEKMDDGPQELVHRHNIVVIPSKKKKQQTDDDEKEDKKKDKSNIKLPPNRDRLTAEEEAIAMAEKMNIF